MVVVNLASNLKPSPKVAYEDLINFGEIMDSKRKSVCSSQTLLVFPEDPKVFMELYPTAYSSEDPPVKCRVSLSEIMWRCRKTMTPCRSTNQHVRGHVAKPGTVHSESAHRMSGSGAQPAPSEAANGVLLSLLEKYMFQSGSAPHVGECQSPRESSLVTSSPSSGAIGSSPAHMFSGGIAPQCLDPRNDKLAQLKAKLSCVESEVLPLEDCKRADDGGATLVLQRLTKKRPQAAEVEGEEEEEAEAEEGSEAKGATMRTLAAAPETVRKSARVRKTLRKPAAAPKAASKGAAKSVYEYLLAKPAKFARPPCTQNPTPYAGGKIYFSKPMSSYRVYVRKGDRIDKRIKANTASKGDMQRAFNICCALIESDTRPRAT